MSKTVPPTPAGDAASRAYRWRFGGVVLDGRSLELSLDEQQVKLEPKPMELLLYLLRHPGEVVTKEELLENLWAGRFLSESVLTKTMAKLRQGLHDESQGLIKTVHGFGYRLAAPVTAEATEQGAAPNLAGLAAGDAIPHRPHWQLKSLLGSGGQGEVWLGWHEKTGEQRVFKFAFDAAGLVALKRELTLFRVLRQTLGDARRDFVRLIDTNLEAPPFFIETEYVAGGALPAWVDAQGGFAAIAPTLRLSLVVQVAESLAAAHSAGVLHKDLKPANILIELGEDGSPQAKLGDFGSGRMMDLARLEQLEITRLGFTQTIAPSPDAASGTPLYLAPELLGGQQPTVQSDLFALGIVLYQLVVGDFKRPLATGWQRLVDDPLLCSDIAAVVDLDPARRLADAGELARRLKSLPARRAQAAAEGARMAESEALRQALIKSTTRRRLLRAVALASCLGLGLSLWQFALARRAQAAAEKAAAESQAIAAFVTEDLLQLADPLGVARPRLTVRDLLDEASRRLEPRLPNQPLAQSKILHALGDAYKGLGDWSRARALLQAALARAEAVEGPEGETSLGTRTALAYATTLTGGYDEAAELYDRVLAATAARPLEDPLRLDAREGRAFLEYERGRYLPAAAAYEALGSDLKRLGLSARLTEVNWSLPDIYLELGRTDEAEKLITQAIAEVQSRTGARHPRVLWMRLTLGDVHMDRGEWDTADAIYLDSLAGLSAMLGAAHPNSLTALHYHGHLLLKRGEAAAALPVLRQAYAGRRAAHGEDHPYTRYSAHRLGQALTALDRTDEALPLLSKILASVEQAQGPRHPNALELRCSLAEALMAADQRREARRLLEESLPWAQQALPPSSPRLRRYLAVQAKAAEPA
ncbi:MAG: tetratricopeptide repeat protein [Pseudomonadota bacterium]